MGWYGDDPRERGERALEKCRSIEAAAKADNRPLTDTEQREHDELFKEAEHCVAMLKKQRADKEFMDGLPNVGSIGGGGPQDKTRRLSFAGVARQAAGRILVSGRPLRTR